MGTLDYLREMSRRVTAQDDNYYKKMLYFFELRVPTWIMESQAYFFPLVLNPESISMDEPFAQEVTQTTDGGVWAEENGIILRQLHIRGHTGFKPRKIPGKGVLSIPRTPAEKRSYDRKLPDVILEAISGQKHFQFLQDAVFRTYADHKRDPEKAEKTKLFWHNVKDDEHWEVIPAKFSMERSASKPVQYNYTIDLVVVAKASAADKDFSEDKSVLDMIKNALQQANNAYQLMAGAVRDLTNFVGEIKQWVAAIGTIISSAISIYEAVADFIEGVTSLIQLPGKMVDNLLDEVETAMKHIASASEELAAVFEDEEDALNNAPAQSPLPIQIHQALSGLHLGASTLLTHRELFETPLQTQIRELAAKQSVGTSASTEELDAAAAGTGPATLNEVNELGTGLMPGDPNRAEVLLVPTGSLVNDYTSAQAVVVEQGDTLMTLAARYMGDARRWREIALLNGLKPPFISGHAASNLAAAEDEEALPGAVGTGKEVLVPTRTRPPEQRPLLPVIGSAIEASSEEKLLGGDLRLEREVGTVVRYDVPVDTDNGAVDAQVVTGISNLQQAIGLRITTERGTDPLYKHVGLDRVVGIGLTAVDRELARFRVLQTVSEDPRIVNTRQVSLTNGTEPEDSLVVDVEAEVYGFVETALAKTVV